VPVADELPALPVTRFEGLLAPKPLLPLEVVPVLPTAELPLADDAPLAPELLAPDPPLAPAPPPLAPPPDCASAMATANSTLANKPKPNVAFFIFDSFASSANLE
jgi:hypothetical protein